ncbi:unnamed protein product [Caenorhabditis auriculariae]|uniref:Uncharacterized protein n=1 Tax=Caenorhabditis auriculariae TaxID=2777116 RepID=A0A8S1HTJ4_9PELO|nr:unnamed protein product [Caenorhabditis auriculariae]
MQTFPLLIFLFLGFSTFRVSSVALDEADLEDYEERRNFHDTLCSKRPNLSSCQSPFTPRKFLDERERLKNEKYLRRPQYPGDLRNRRRDSPWWDDSDDEDYEYYLWKKRRRQLLRRKHLQVGGPEYHYHYQPSSNYYNQQPTYSSYPSYGGYGYGYPSYGGYGGYGGGGGLFNIGFGRQLGIMTPIGGFGYSSGFGIGIG